MNEVDIVFILLCLDELVFRKDTEAGLVLKQVILSEGQHRYCWTLTQCLAVREHDNTIENVSVMCSIHIVSTHASIPVIN